MLKMGYNLDDIKSELVNNIKDIFEKSTNPNYFHNSNNFDFEEGIDLFFKVVIYNCGINKLDGLTKTIIPTLFEAYVSNRGELKPLKILSSELEAYLKKLVYIISNRQEDFSEDTSKTLLPLFNRLQLNSTQLTKYYLESNSLLLSGRDEFIEFLYQSYITRNQVHVSPNWKLSQIATYLESVLVTYLYATFKYYNVLTPIVDDITLPRKLEKGQDSNDNDPTTQALYDFISFNNGTSKIRTQIVTSFILHELNRCGGRMTLEEIKLVCNKQFNTTTDISFYKNIIRELSNKELNKVTVSGIYKDEINITVSERDRIDKVKEHFFFQEQVFNLEINEILKTYNLEDKSTQVVDHLRALFESNFNIDLLEIFDKGFEAVDNSENVSFFIDFLKTIEVSNNSAENLFRELLIVCSGNDFLARLTAGQAFAKIMNPEQMQEYINQKERVVYLDANVLLHALCYYYYDNDEYNDFYYQSTKELIKYTRNNKNITLKASSLYALEVAYQLKEALLLIPFEEIGLFREIGNSNNVFYKYYIDLKYSDKLDDDVENFSDFMSGFELEEDNLYDRNFLYNTSGIVRELLDTINIEVIDIPILPIDDTIEIVKNTLTIEGKLKGPEQIKNDAIMVYYLSDKEIHTNEPTFVTWDNMFNSIRKRHISKNRNAKMWHLFTPTKMLSHFQLLEFKIDSKSIANDFLTIIDGINFQDKTRNILDTVGTLFDISKEERRKYLLKFKEFNAVYVFNMNDHEQDITEDRRENKPVEKILSELNRHYANRDVKYSFKDFKSLFSQKLMFDNIILIFQRELEYYMKERKFSEKLFLEFDQMILSLKTNI